MRGENVPVIFGLKLRQLREKRGLGLKELSGMAGMSPSYVNEIEKGKKYPKADKILGLAEALGVSYDELVSLKLSQELNPVESVLDSPILQALPLQIFGLAPRDIVDLISRAPQEAGALIRTLVELARSYDMHVEHFFYAMLRSYQETHDNHFPEIEAAVERLRTAQGWSATEPPAPAELRRLLVEQTGAEIDEHGLDAYPELARFRSVWVRGAPPRLLLNANLAERQKVFQIGREIGYHDLGLQVRGVASSRADVESFEQVLNDFKASYYAGALLIPQQALVRDLEDFFGRERWERDGFLALMRRYDVTPEMLMYRLTQIAPWHFRLRGLHFVRVNHHRDDDSYRLSKQLNMSGLLIPAGIGMHEHYCRRWNAVHLLATLARGNGADPAAAPHVAVQRARFITSGESYFLLTLARPLALTPGTNTSVTLGFKIDNRFKSVVKFWDDEQIPTQEVHETCERCPLGAAECTVRAAPPVLYEQRLRTERRNAVLQAVVDGAPAP